MGNQKLCEDCELSGINNPHEKGGCYDCDDDHNNFSRKDRFEIKRGRFGCYFYDREAKQEIDLESVQRMREYQGENITDLFHLYMIFQDLEIQSMIN